MPQPVPQAVQGVAVATARDAAVVHRPQTRSFDTPHGRRNTPYRWSNAWASRQWSNAPVSVQRYRSSPVHRSRTRLGAYSWAENSPPSMRPASRSSHHRCSLNSSYAEFRINERSGDSARPLRPFRFADVVVHGMGHLDVSAVRLLAPCLHQNAAPATARSRSLGSGTGASGRRGRRKPTRD